MATSTIKNIPSVMAQGTSGGWYYRKWSDGVYESWKYAWGTNSTSFAAWGNLYYADIDGPAFPITFTETPVCLVTPHGSQSYIIGIWGVTTSKLSKIRFAHNTTSAAEAYANIYVRGFWK